MSHHGAAEDYRVSRDQIDRERIGSENLALRFIPRVLKRFFPDRSASSLRLLDVGCGIGAVVARLRSQGYDAWGIEPGGRFHDRLEGARDYVLNVYAHQALSELPRFDLVFSSGVIEHVGTTDGHGELSKDYLQYRVEFLESQLALLDSDGVLMVCGPNRLFPFDFQHGPHTYGGLSLLKRAVPAFKHLTIPWHPRNFLSSFDELQRILSERQAQVEFFTETQIDYLGLSALGGRKALRAAFDAYIGTVSILPRRVRKYLEPSMIFICRSRRG